MVILVIDNFGVLSVESEGQPPVAIDRNCVSSFLFALQFMKVPSRKVHVLWLGSPIQVGQQAPQAACVTGDNPTLIALVEKFFKAGVSK